MNFRRGNLVLVVLAAGLVAAMVYLGSQKRHPDTRGQLPPPLSWMNTPAPMSPFELPFEGQQSLDPLNLREVGLINEGDPTLVGVVGTQTVTAQEVDERGVGVLRRAVEPLAAAQKRGLTWLAERNALEFEAKRAGQPLAELLLAAYETLPPPTDAELETLRPSDGRPDADPEARAAVRAQWRMLKWRAKRSLIVKVGARTDRIVLVSSAGGPPPGFTPGADVVAIVGERQVTRDQLQRLAGLADSKARSDYYLAAQRTFHTLVGDLAIEAEAKRLKLTDEQLFAKALKEYPPVSKADVDEHLRINPGYLKMKDGLKIVHRHLDMARSTKSRQALKERLRQATPSEFRLVAPKPVSFAIEPVRPLVIGKADSTVTVVALHAFGTRVGQEFGQELMDLTTEYGDRVRFEILPHYPNAETLIPYRAALGLYCAQEQGRTAEYFRDVLRTYPHASIEALSVKAEKLGLDGAKFRQCLSDDRYLPFVFENRLLAERIGLEDGEPALFVGGRFVEGFKDRRRARAAINAALGIPEPASQPASAAGADAGVAVKAPQQDAGAPASQGTVPGAKVSDPVVADLQTLKARVERDMADARRALRQPKGVQGDTPDEMAAAMRALSGMAQKVATSFGTYKAMTPEVKKMCAEASGAWKEYGDHAQRLAAAAMAQPPNRDRAKAELEALGKAQKRVEDVMRQFSRAFKERGI